MFLFGKKQPAPDAISVIFDVGNGSVAGSLVRLSKTGKPTVLYTHREPMDISSEQTAESLVESMLRLVRIVTENIHSEGIKHLNFTKYRRQSISGISCVFSSPWYVSQTKTINVEKQKPFTVSKAYIDSILSNEEVTFEKSLREGAYMKLFGNDISVIERRVIETKLNGYSVSDPYGKSAKHLELSFFTSVVPGKIIRDVESVIHRSFNFRHVNFHSFALTTFSTLRDMFPHDHDFIFMDVTGEVTDISIVRHDVLLETVSFPLGRASLVRKLGSALSVTPRVALSYMSLHGEDSLAVETSDKLLATLEAFGKEWADVAASMLRDVSHGTPLPQKLFVTADPDIAPFLSRSIEKNIAGGIAASSVSHEMLKPLLAENSEAEGDVFIMLESVFLNKLFALKK